MTLTEAKAQVEQLITMTRSLMPTASDREIHDAVFRTILTPRNVSEQVVEDYGMLRLALTDVTGNAHYRNSHASFQE